MLAFSNFLIKRTVSLYTSRCISTTSNLSAHWNKDWLPGPYPKTKEERIKAAQKYGLHPAEYKPISNEEGNGYGDYPQLPYIGLDLKDKNYPWDYPVLRRNFNEVVPIDINFIGEDRHPAGLKERYSTLFMFTCLVSLFGGLILACLFCPIHLFQPVLEKQMPFETDRKHYTFELE